MKEKTEMRGRRIAGRVNEKKKQVGKENERKQTEIKGRWIRKKLVKENGRKETGTGRRKERLKGG